MELFSIRIRRTFQLVSTLVELDVVLPEVLHMFGKEVQHVRFAVIGFLAQGLVGECALTAVALQGTLADLEEHAQVLIVEKADAFGQGRRLLPLRLHSQQQLVLTVEAFEDFLHPSLEIVSGKQFHTYFLLPLSVFLPPVRNE